ncbi:hypothetical protein [Arcanobacterium phocae]|uniref:hypothetical protein n=1 Tax=Arcanobacterium phocae TaxID=131112 RepID=UPI001C0F2277|nr:hypothetical protein [Arcanobacterium phocae]
MSKWFSQAREIERLRHENQRLLALVAQLKNRLGDNASSVDIFGVSAEERRLALSGRKIEAIKTYRERTGADLLTAKKAIDSVS